MSKSLFMALSLVLLVAGLLVVFSSVTWGSEAANAFLRSRGGGMDTAQFVIVLEGYINAYRWIGGILSFIGGLALMRAIELR